MKISKAQGVSFFVAIIAFAILSVALFISPAEKSIVFWLGYLFIVYAMLVMFVTLFKFFNKEVNGEQFLNLPVMVISWFYVLAQFYLSYREIISPFLPYKVALILNLTLGLVFTGLILVLGAATGKIEKNEQKVAEKVLFIRELKTDLQSIDTSDKELSKKIENLVEEISYSDPMSHSRLADIENSIKEKVAELEGCADDTSKAVALCDDIAKLLKKRNSQCLNLKGVKDEAEKTQEKGEGNKIAIIGIGAAFAVVLGVLALIFFIAPESDYKKACALMDEEKYELAITAFEGLKGYKDSDQKIEEINEIKLKNAYDSAVELMENERYDAATEAFKALGDYADSVQKIEEIDTIIHENAYAEAMKLMETEAYDDAIKAFEALDGYKDSNEKIEEIKNTVIEEKYVKAEQAMADGDYETALALYNEITPYKDSQDKIVTINNRQSEDSIMYLGTYDGKPVAWRIVEMDGYNKMLLLADQPIRDLPISDDITDTSFENSDIARWLNNDFIADFTQTDLDQIIETGGVNVFLLSEADVNRLKSKGVDLSADTDWWLKSESNKGFKYATSDGKVESAGDIHLRDKGVRPAIWINLK